MRYLVYRQPLYCDEKKPVYYGSFESYMEAELAINTQFVEEDWYFYEDFYIVEEDL